jgi:acyl-coenzyme A thioesterase PaaI-like protein
VVCNPANALGLRIEFILQPDNSVTGEFVASAVYEGYPGLVHGGVTAALLDGAMTNCLFAHGIEALTAELTVRYREPVEVHDPIALRAHQVHSHGQFHLLRAELRQSGRLKATACGKFMQKHQGRAPYREVCLGQESPDIRTAEEEKQPQHLTRGQGNA